MTTVISGQGFVAGAANHVVRRTPFCCPKLPPLQASEKHAVLFKVSDDLDSRTKPPLPHPEHFEAASDNDFVKLPCSSIDDKNSNGASQRQCKWELINKALSGKAIRSVTELERAVVAYNSHYPKNQRFEALHKLFNADSTLSHKFFTTTLPGIVQLALKLPELCTQPIPKLKCQKEGLVSFTQEQVACLMCNAFLCTFPSCSSFVEPEAKDAAERKRYPLINFIKLHCQSDDVSVEKEKFILQYFKTILETMPTGTVTFERRVLSKDDMAQHNWSMSNAALTKVHVRQSGTIEDDGSGMLQVDFADPIIGGFVLTFGCVQEEIRFLICPELIVARLITEVLEDNECLIATDIRICFVAFNPIWIDICRSILIESISGCERYNLYTGYGVSLKWGGPYDGESLNRDIWGRSYIQLLAIDAINFYCCRNDLQYQPTLIDRELNKAYCGFHEPGSSAHSLTTIATGNWGCGVFAGDKELKSMIQLLAASEAGRELIYFTFDDDSLAHNLTRISSLLLEKSLTVGRLYTMLIAYSYEVKCGYISTIPSVFQFVMDQI